VLAKLLKSDPEIDIDPFNISLTIVYNKLHTESSKVKYKYKNTHGNIYLINVKAKIRGTKANPKVALRS